MGREHTPVVLEIRHQEIGEHVVVTHLHALLVRQDQRGIARWQVGSLRVVGIAGEDDFVSCLRDIEEVGLHPDYLAVGRKSAKEHALLTALKSLTHGVNGQRMQKVPAIRRIDALFAGRDELLVVVALLGKDLVVLRAVATGEPAGLAVDEQGEFVVVGYNGFENAVLGSTHGSSCSRHMGRNKNAGPVVRPWWSICKILCFCEKGLHIPCSSPVFREAKS